MPNHTQPVVTLIKNKRFMIKSREINLRFCHLETCFSQRSVKLISCCYNLSVVNLPLAKLNYFCNVKNVIENMQFCVCWGHIQEEKSSQTLLLACIMSPIFLFPLPPHQNLVAKSLVRLTFKYLIIKRLKASQYMKFIYTAKQIKNDIFQFTVTFLLKSLIIYILEIS